MTGRIGLARLGASASGLALATAFAAIAHPAAAQTQSQPTPAAATTSSSSPEVTVTAERRTVNLQTAPLAATVLSGAQLQKMGVYNVDQLQFLTPSLTVTNYGLGEDFNIRGIGKEETNVQTPSGVVTYRDGVATFPGFFTQEPYFDLASVEVLRGPQGTFAGQNASGGAIFITENQASTSAAHAFIEAQYGNYNDVRLRGWLNMPVNDNFAIRIAVHAEHEDSYYKVSGPFTGDPGRLQDFDGRISLVWTPTPQWRIALSNDSVYYDNGGLTASVLPLPPAPNYPTYAISNGLFNTVDDVHSLGISYWNRSVLNVGYTFSNGTVLKSITGYQAGYIASQASIDGNLNGDSFPVKAAENIASEEVNLISPNTGRFKWVVGAYYQDDVVRIPFGLTGFDIHTPPLDILLHYTTPKTTEAVFGQATFDLTDRLQLVAGARYTHSQFTLSDTTSLLLFGLPGAIFGLPPETAHAVQNDDKVTGKIDLNWKINDTNFVYAFIATGHKPGGINTTPVPFGPAAFPVVPFQPEDLTDYEIGWKPTFFDGHLRGQFDAFYTTYQKFQLSFATAVGGGGGAPGQSIIRNVPGTTVIWGLEAQAQGVFGDFSFDVAADYLNTRLGGGAQRLGDPSGFPELIGGNRMVYAPQWTFDVGAQYVFHMGDGSTLTPRFDYSYIGDQWASPFEGRDLTLPSAFAALERYAYHLAPVNLLNAQITWDKAHTHVTLFGTNILNDKYFYETGQSAPPIAPGVGVGFGVLRQAAPPAEYGIRVSRDF
ncbi:MAG TPA: TonB-dependent receptor [Caulobacteraceae bacterium]|nr:TonB-dependent receptor [Caulobacteraceae bacterium]